MMILKFTFLPQFTTSFLLFTRSLHVMIQEKKRNRRIRDSFDLDSCFYLLNQFQLLILES